MEDFKVIFYIAIAIAWFVYKNYQKVQQNRPKTINPPGTQPVSVTTERKISEMVSEKAQPFIPAKKTNLKKEFNTYSKSKQVKVEIKRKPLTIDSSLSLETTLPGATEKKVAEASTVTKDFSEEDLFDLKKFDIRTAIIYSEILKRPYV